MGRMNIEHWANSKEYFNKCINKKKKIFIFFLRIEDLTVCKCKRAKKSCAHYDMIENELNIVSLFHSSSYTQ